MKREGTIRIPTVTTHAGELGVSSLAAVACTGSDRNVNRTSYPNNSVLGSVGYVQRDSEGRERELPEHPRSIIKKNALFLETFRRPQEA